MLAARLKRLNYRHVLPDAVLIAVSLYASLYLRVGPQGDWHQFLPVLNRHLLLFLAIRLGTFFSLGVYDIIWRYVSLNDAVRLIRAISISSILIISATYVVDIGRVPRALFFIDWCLISCFLAGIRFGRRMVYDHQGDKKSAQFGKLGVIYGAGANGRTLAQRCQTDDTVGFNLVGFIDDDPQKVGRIVAGCKVLGTRKELAAVLRDLRVRELIVAVAHPTGDLLREVVSICREQNIRPRLMTGIQSRVADDRPIETIREVELPDLLSRPPKRIDLSTVRDLIRNRRVLITGAGGSIGSELSRQILAASPGRLLLVDHSEYNLYKIDNELRVSASDINGITVPILVNVTDGRQMERVFKEYAPEIVFHAAAYKHVHLVEANPSVSILNNIHGTRVLLTLSERYNVRNFVLVSTDKAVNSVGIMGATKRVCELLLAQSALRTGRHYCAVRFGNVLGSSGSLIPLLQQQIRSGQPVTVTHRDVTRYFMLIPEAVSLVLLAATKSNPGDIMILKMGEPVRIVELAQSLIALMGKRPEECPIIYTGLRPGEKLFEELYLSGKEVETDHEDILVLPRGDGADLLMDTLDEQVDQVIEFASRGDSHAVHILRSLANANVILARGERPLPLRSIGESAETTLN